MNLIFKNCSNNYQKIENRKMIKIDYFQEVRFQERSYGMESYCFLR